ncbi:Uncharacterised protein [Vibrio cholerae]|uniref:Uncharacterized protein n=1 Tax=Vibrio cholerae TaxID=666 RepID=A0A656AIV6_VIBCL|nr:Uncharacterised protein [Vibrio cholerae]CSD13082.1 Uncharacterised protein [Vibrio cholerae]CSI96877.1 Uncharacterised protein [Vibrio cholerae]
MICFLYDNSGAFESLTFNEWLTVVRSQQNFFQLSDQWVAWVCTSTLVIKRFNR